MRSRSLGLRKKRITESQVEKKRHIARTFKLHDQLRSSPAREPHRTRLVAHLAFARAAVTVIVAAVFIIQNCRMVNERKHSINVELQAVKPTGCHIIRSCSL